MLQGVGARSANIQGVGVDVLVRTYKGMGVLTSGHARVGGIRTYMGVGVEGIKHLHLN